MNAEKTWEDIRDLVAAFAKENDVRVLYACEAGSKAWGFPSADSDWDIRVVFAYPPRRLASILQPIKNTISYKEKDGDRVVIDLEAWSLQHFGKLLATSNCSVLEWLMSPMVYMQVDGFLEEARALMNQMEIQLLMFHYQKMSMNNYHRVFGKEPSAKKYLHVLRAAAMFYYLEKNRRLPEDVYWEATAPCLPYGLEEKMGTLVRQKMERTEQVSVPYDELSIMMTDFNSHPYFKYETKKLLEPTEALVQKYQFQ